VTSFVLSRRAEADLQEIWSYSEAQWGGDRAELYIRDLYAAMQRLAADPLGGVACDHIREGYRRRRSGSHVIFFQTRGKDVRIVRILHQRMDFARHL